MKRNFIIASLVLITLANLITDLQALLKASEGIPLFARLQTLSPLHALLLGDGLPVFLLTKTALTALVLGLWLICWSKPRFSRFAQWSNSLYSVGLAFQTGLFLTGVLGVLQQEAGMTFDPYDGRFWNIMWSAGAPWLLLLPALPLLQLMLGLTHATQRPARTAAKDGVERSDTHQTEFAR
jgi:hypothetical protein